MGSTVSLGQSYSVYKLMKGVDAEIQSEIQKEEIERLKRDDINEQRIQQQRNYYDYDDSYSKMWQKSEKALMKDEENKQKEDKKKSNYNYSYGYYDYNNSNSSYYRN